MLERKVKSQDLQGLTYEQKTRDLSKEQLGLLGSIKDVLDRIFSSLMGRDPKPSEAAATPTKAAETIQDLPELPDFPDAIKLKPNDSKVKADLSAPVAPIKEEEAPSDKSEAAPEEVKSSGSPVEVAIKPVVEQVTALSEAKAEESKANQKPQEVVVKNERERGANGRFVSSKSQAEEAQEEQRKKREGDSILAQLAKGAAFVAGAPINGVNAAMDNEATDDVGKSVAGAEWQAGSELVKSARDLKGALTDGIEAFKKGFKKTLSVGWKSLAGTVKAGRWLGKAVKNPVKTYRESKQAIGDRYQSMKDGIKGRAESTKGGVKGGLAARKAELLGQNKKEDVADKNQQEQTDALEEKLDEQTKAIVDAVEDNAGAGSESGGMLDSLKGLFGGKKSGGLGGLAKTAGKFLKVGGPLAALAAGGSKLAEVWDDDELSTGQKSAQVASTAGGALAGAAGGAAAGAFLGPVGMLAGAAIGGFAGSEAGEWLGDKFSDWLGDDSPKDLMGADVQKAETVSSAEVGQAGQTGQAGKVQKIEPVTAQSAPVVRKITKEDIAKSERSAKSSMENNYLTNAQKGPESKGVDPKDISDPIVKAIKESAAANNVKDAYNPDPIPTDFEGDLINLMAHDRL